MGDPVTKMVTGLLPDGTLIRACEVTFEYFKKQEERIEKLESALLEIFDHECRTSDKSFIACVARDALWHQALDAK
jgi:hypothetical protein